MIRILFVCLGNICRSPMAEYVMKELLRRGGVCGVEVASAATSREEEGNDVYPPARRKLEEQGVPCPPRRAAQITRADYTRYDVIVGMEPRNLEAMRRMFGGDPAGKLRLLLGYAGEQRGIADPWYTGDFDAAYRDVVQGCEALLGRLQEGRPL